MRWWLHIFWKVMLTVFDTENFFLSPSMFTLIKTLLPQVMVKDICPQRSKWRENSYHRCRHRAQIPTKFVHCQISVECHQSFNNTNTTIWTKCFSIVDIEVLVVTIQFTFVYAVWVCMHMCLCTRYILMLYIVRETNHE